LFRDREILGTMSDGLDDQPPGMARTMNDDDATTIRAAAAGDRVAFRRIYDTYVQRVHGQVGRLVGWGVAAEDVTQEVFIEVFRALPTFRGDSTLATWIHRITRNVAIAHLRRRGLGAIDLATYRGLGESVLQPDLDARRQVAALYAALDAMPIEAREAFIAFEIEGQSLADIAALSGEPLHTIASRVRRTRERLRTLLERVTRDWRKAQ